MSYQSGAHARPGNPEGDPSVILTRLLEAQQAHTTAIVNLAEKFMGGLARIEEQLEMLQMTESQTQQDIDNAVATITAFLTDVQSDNATILSDLQQLQTDLANGQPVDTSKLNSIISTVAGTQSNLDSAVQSVSNLASNPTGASTGSSSSGGTGNGGAATNPPAAGSGTTSSTPTS